MNKLVINRLLDSFSELERAITTAKLALSRKSNPPQDLLERISHYEHILDKQRVLASSLSRHVANNNWEEVGRHVRIINGLSSMIRDDARELVSGFRPQLTTEERELMLS